MSTAPDGLPVFDATSQTFWAYSAARPERRPIATMGSGNLGPEFPTEAQIERVLRHSDYPERDR